MGENQIETFEGEKHGVSLGICVVQSDLLQKRGADIVQIWVFIRGDHKTIC